MSSAYRLSTILNAKVTSTTFDESLDLINKSIKDRKRTNHIVVNAGKLVAMQTDQRLYESVRDADLVNADGQSVVWASRLLGNRLPERVAGIDLMQALVQVAAENGYKIFFLGAKEQVVAKVVETYRQEYGDEILAGYRNGYYAEEQEEQVAKDIAESNADILFVAITSPKKEIFLNKYKDTIRVPFTMGVGGSFDVVAGVTKRAPNWMQEIGLEWLYRLIQEPRRMWKRYLVGNSRFIALIIRQRLGLYSNPFE